MVLYIGHSTAGVINFNDIPEQMGINTFNIGDIYQSDNFQITGIPSFASSNTGFHVHQQGSLNWTGSTALTYFGVSAEIELKNISGNLFDIYSIDISRGDSNSSLIPVTFYGKKSDDTQVVQTYIFKDSIRGKSDSFFFSEDFKNLTSLIWYQGAEWHQFDNLNVNLNINSVPEPSTFILLLLTLICLLVFGFIQKRFVSNQPVALAM